MHMSELTPRRLRYSHMGLFMDMYERTPQRLGYVDIVRFMGGLYYLKYFFLMIGRPPKSTPFPYTTLFRSIRFPAAIHPWRGWWIGHDWKPCNRSSKEIGRAPRLNSSHLGISYAVFCLK